MLSTSGLGLFGQPCEHFFAIGLTPTYLLDPITPSIGLSVEASLLPRVNVEVLYGYDLGVENKAHPDPLATHHEYKLTLKYLSKEKTKSGVHSYWGLDFFGSYNAYQKADDVFAEGRNYFYYEQADVIRQVAGLRLNYGFKQQLRKRIWLDIYAGIGTRYVDVAYRPVNSMLIDEANIPRERFWSIDQNAGRKNTPAFIVGLKLEYNLGKLE